MTSALRLRPPVAQTMGAAVIDLHVRCLLPIGATGPAMFGLMVGLPQLLPGRWHDGAVGVES